MIRPDIESDKVIQVIVGRFRFVGRITGSKIPTGRKKKTATSWPVIVFILTG